MRGLGNRNPSSDLASVLAGDDARKHAVWAKGRLVEGLDPYERREDDLGHRIRYSDYKNTTSAHGWQIDHIVPVAIGGADHIFNLRPLHRRANASRGGLLGAALRERR